MRKLVLLAAVVVLALAACGSDEPATSSGTTKIRFSFDWKCGMDWAPLLWAQDQGYFAAEHVEVSHVTGNGASAVVPLVASGEQHIAQVSAPPVVLGASEELPITVVGTLMTSSPVALFADGSIKQPKDLEGKKVAVQVQEFEGAVWKAFVKKAGLDESKIEEVPASGTSNTLFIDHRVDAFISFYPDLGTPSLLDGRKGEETVFQMKDYVPSYGHTMIVNNRFLQEHGDAVRGFLRAWAKGIAYSIGHQKESVDAVLAKCPEVERGPAEFSIGVYAALWDSPEAKQGGILSFTPDGLNQTKQLLVDGGLMKDIDIGSLSSTQYLPDPPVMP